MSRPRILAELRTRLGDPGGAGRTPLLVLVSWAIGRPMTLVFDPLDLFAIAGTAFIVNAIAADGETTWFEGVLLIGVYALLGLAFFFAG